MSICELVGVKEPQEVSFIKRLWNCVMNPLGAFLSMLFRSMITMLISPVSREMADKGRMTVDAIEKAAGRSQRAKRRSERLKKMMRLFRKIAETATKIFKTIANALCNFANPVAWIVWGVTILALLVVLMSLIFGRYGTFNGELRFDMNQMQSMNQDEERYTNLLNSAALRQSFYEDVADTSVWQTFTLHSHQGETQSLNDVLHASLADLFKDDTRASKSLSGVAGSMGIKVYDDRYTVTDANKNPAKYLMQAESLGTYSDAYGLTSYFRDYYGREESFTLSPDFLYELNRWVYQNDTAASEYEKIVYPEAFTQPVSYVRDYLRIQNDPMSKVYGEPYVYVTQRVTLEDIRNSASPYYEQYAMEGIIVSTPSDVVYDYAILGMDAHEVQATGRQSDDYSDETHVARYAVDDVTVTYNDGTSEKTQTLVRLYWIVNPAYMSRHMSEDLHDAISLDEVRSLIRRNLRGAYDTGYRCGSEAIVIPADCTDPYIGPYYGLTVVNGVLTFAGQLTDTVTVNHQTISYELNQYPSKHYQLAPIYDEEGNIQIYSRNLFNKTYIKLPTVRPAYRNSDAYWDDFESFVMEDLGRAMYSDEQIPGYSTFVNGKLVYVESRDPQTQEITYTVEPADWLQRKCSLLYACWGYHNWTNSVTAVIDNLFGAGDNAVEDVNAIGVYEILVAYEDYLTTYGTEGVEWEYKYYTSTQSQRDETAAAIKGQVNLFGLKLEDVTGASQWFKTSTDIYQTTFESVVSLNADRTISTEYTPVAELTDEEWGWKYSGRDANDHVLLTKVYGEVSYQLPEYYTAQDPIPAAVLRQRVESQAADNDYGVRLWETAAYNDFISQNTVLNVDYGTIAYGKPYFGYVWQSVDGQYILAEMPEDTAWDYAMMIKSAKQAYENQLLHYAMDSVGDFVRGSTLELPFDLSVGVVADAVAIWQGSKTATDALRDTWENIVDDLFGWVRESDAAVALAEMAAQDYYDAYEDPVSLPINDLLDIQNTEEAWNPYAVTYRPTDDGFMMQANESQRGRVTTKEDSDDWLAMELKSVRDYGLGSVLNYLETRKVTFVSALALTEVPDTVGMKQWFIGYYTGKGYSGDVLDALVSRGMSGYYPATLLDTEVNGKTLRDYVQSAAEVCVTNPGSGREDWSTLVDKFGVTLDETDLKRIANGLNSLQGSGRSVFTYKGLKFTVSYVTDDNDDSTLSDGGYVLMIGKDGESDGWMRANITVVIPYLSQSFMEDFFRNIRQNFLTVFYNWSGRSVYTDADAEKEAGNQFFDPQGYYLAWFDYVDNATLIEQTVALLKNVEMVSTYDNHFSKQIRDILSGVHSTNGKVVLDDNLSFVERMGSTMQETWTWIASNVQSLFGVNDYSKYRAGLYMTSDQWTALYNTMADASRQLELIDNTATGKVYLINEAVTFIGNFLYTYDTRLLVAGTLDGEDRVVSGMAYADRYYAISNYIFKVGTDATTVVWSDMRYDWHYADTSILTFCRSILDRTGIDSNEVSAEDFLADPTFLTWVYQCDPALATQNFANAAAFGGQWNSVEQADTFVVKARNALKDCGRLTGDGKKYVENIRDFVVADNFYLMSYGFEEGDNGQPLGFTFDLEMSEEEFDALVTVTEDLSDDPDWDEVDTNWAGYYDGGVLSGLTAQQIACIERYYRANAGDWSMYHLTVSANISLVWCSKYGVELPYEYVNDATVETPAVYVDSLTEIKELYQALVDAGHKDTANKLLLGIRVYNEYNKAGAGTTDYDAVKNRKGNADEFAHFYSDVDGSGNLYDSRVRHDEDYLWAQFAKLNGVSAAYGDTDNHYAALSDVNAYLTGVLDSSDSAEIALLQRGVMRNGVLTDAGWTMMMDTDGNYNDIGLTIDTWLTSPSQVSMLTDEDIDNIYQSINRLFGTTYAYDGNILIDEDSIYKPIKLDANEHEYDSEYGTVYFWNTTVHGAALDSALNDAAIVLGPQSDRTAYCTVNYVKSPWMQNGLDTNTTVAASLYQVPIIFDSDFVGGSDWYPSETLYYSPNETQTLNTLVYYQGNNALVAAKYRSGSRVCPKIWELRPVIEEHYQHIVYARTLHSQAVLTDNVEVGLNMADRSSYGTLIPTYTGLYGYKKQIAPTQTGAYFNEEVYSDWMRRIGSDTLSAGKSDYLLDYHEKALSYMYDYLTEFETYLPLGVMSDADLWVRGGEAYMSIAANTNRPFEYADGYLSTIANDLQTTAWQNVFANYASTSGSLSGYAANALVADVQRFLENRTGMHTGAADTVSQDAMAQYVAGLIETTYEYGPFVMISYYNRSQSTPIEYSDENYDAIRDGMALSRQYGASSVDQCVKVTLLLEDGTKRNYDLLYLGAAAIPCYTNIGSTVLTTDDTASHIVGFGTQTLTVRPDYDERLDADKALKFMTVKFGKLLHKYGNASSACMAYFYGEQYWDAMLAIAHTQGISTGPEWKNDDPMLVRGAVESVLQADSLLPQTSVQHGHDNFLVFDTLSDEMLTQLFTAEIAEYALEFVQESDNRLLLLKSSASPLGATALQVGTKASFTRDLYDSFKAASLDFIISVNTYEDGTPYLTTNVSRIIAQYDMSHIDDVCNMYGIDTGLIMAVIEASSGGDPMYGLFRTHNDQGSMELDAINQSDRNTKMGLFGLTGPAEGTADKISATLTQTLVDTSSLMSAESSVGTTVSTVTRYYDRYAPASIIGLYYSSRDLDLGDFHANKSYTEHNIDMIESFLTQDMRFSITERNGYTYPTAMEYAIGVLTSAYERYDGDVLSALYDFYYDTTGVQLANLKRQACQAGYGANWYQYWAKNKGEDNLIAETLRYYDASMAGSSEMTVSVTKTERATAADSASHTLYTVVNERAHASITQEVTKTITTGDDSTTPWHNLDVLNVPGEWLGAVGTLPTKLRSFLPIDTDSLRISSVEFIDREEADGIANAVYRYEYENLSDEAVRYLRAAYTQAVANASVYTDVHEYDGEINETVIFGGNRAYYALSPMATVEFEEENSEDSYLYYALLQLDVTGTGSSVNMWYQRFLQVGRNGSIETVGGKQYLFVWMQVPSYGNLGLDNMLYVDINGCFRCAELCDALSSSGSLDEQLAADGYAAARPVAYMKGDGTIVAQNDDYKASYQMMCMTIGGNTLPVKLLNRKKLVITIRMNDILYLNSSGRVPHIDVTRNNLSLWSKLASQNLPDLDALLRDGVMLVDKSEPDAAQARPHTLYTVQMKYKPLVNGSGIVYGEEGSQQTPILRTDTVWHIHYDNAWSLTAAGNNVSLMSLFSHTSSFNEYTADKVAQQNSGIMVYDDSPLGSRKDVQLVIVGYTSTYDELLTPITDFSVMSFFADGPQKIKDEDTRSWFGIASNERLLTVGEGTINECPASETADFPVLCMLDYAPTGSRILTVDAEFGRGVNPLTGTSFLRSGMVFSYPTYSSVTAVFDGTVVEVDYNAVYGHYVVVERRGEPFGILASTTGDRYQLNGMRAVYGYLDDAITVCVGDQVTAGQPIRGVQSGISGMCTGDQLYFELRVHADILDPETDERIGSVQWDAVDPEPYFTSVWTIPTPSGGQERRRFSVVYTAR